MLLQGFIAFNCIADAGARFAATPEVEGTPEATPVVDPDDPAGPAAPATPAGTAEDAAAEDLGTASTGLIDGTGSSHTVCRQSMIYILL